MFMFLGLWDIAHIRTFLFIYLMKSIKKCVNAKLINYLCINNAYL